MTYSRRMVFPALICAGILWGITVPLSKVALTWMAPAWLAFARFALAAVVLMVVSRFRLRGVCSPRILIAGAAGYGGSVLLQNLGIERTSVTHAALFIGVTPVLVALMAAALGHSVARPLAWVGFGLSLAGVAFIAAGQGAGSTLGGDGLVLASQLASAGFTVSQARLLRGQDPIAVTAVQLIAAAGAMLPFALITESHPVAGPVRVPSVLAVAGLVLAGTVLPTALFAFGQSRVSADVAGAFLNLEPLVGAIIGTLLFADPVGPLQLAGGGAIVAGIGLSSLQVARSERLRRSRPAVMPVPAAAGSAPGVLTTAEAAPKVASAAGLVSAGLVSAGPVSAGPVSAGPVLRLPGQAPSMVRRTRLPRSRADAAARLRRRRLRPSGRAGRLGRTGRARRRQARRR